MTDEKTFESLVDKLMSMPAKLRNSVMSKLRKQPAQSSGTGGGPEVSGRSKVQVAYLPTEVHTKCISCGNTTLTRTKKKYTAIGVPMPKVNSIKEIRLWCPECQVRLMIADRKLVVRQYMALCQSISRQPVDMNSVEASLSSVTRL